MSRSNYIRAIASGPPLSRTPDGMCAASEAPHSTLRRLPLVQLCRFARGGRWQWWPHRGGPVLSIDGREPAHGGLANIGAATAAALAASQFPAAAEGNVLVGGAGWLGNPGGGWLKACWGNPGFSGCLCLCVCPRVTLRAPRFAQRGGRTKIPQ